MAFNGSGTFTRLFTWATDKTNQVPVTASRMDSEMDGMATGLSSCLVKDGQQTATARIPFAAGVSSMAGSISSASYSQSNDANTGLYFPNTDEVGLAAGGVAVLTSTATTVTVPVNASVAGTLGVTGTVTASGNVTVSGILSAATAAKCWAYVTVSGGTPTLQASNNITSITDTDVGELTITIATDFSSVNWVSLNSTNQFHSGASTTSKAAGATKLLAWDSTHSPVDPSSYNFVGFGAQ